MAPERSLQGNGGQVGRLQKVVVPIRSGLSDAAEGLSHAMTRVNSIVGDMRLRSARDFMARSPLIALVLAAGVGFLVGLSRSRRR